MQPHIPYWLDEPQHTRQAIHQDLQTDVLVIGGGLCGTAALLYLAEQGLNPVLIDSRNIAQAATGRNAGFILQGTAERYSRAIATLGHDKAQAIHRWSLINHERIANRIRTYNIECGYAKNGSLQLANSPSEEADLRESMKLLLADGFEAQWLTEHELGPGYTENGFRMGLLLPEDGELHPARYVHGLAKAAVELGATIYSETPALSVIEGLDGVAVTTPNATIEAQVVLVCTNAYTPSILPWFKDKIDPVRGQMLATAPAPKVFDRPIYADHGYDYWRQDEKGSIVLGGWRNLDPDAEVGFEETLNPDIQSAMTRFIQQFPQLKDTPISHRWSGIMGFSVDGLPILGAPPGMNAVLVAAGFTGHGFGFAQLAGEAIAEVALEGQHSFVDALSARRFL
ncbi:MAG: NAD(P)/FAD-dependent oxidoreductase [Myxococcota bacterium]